MAEKIAYSRFRFVPRSDFPQGIKPIKTKMRPNTTIESVGVKVTRPNH